MIKIIIILLLNSFILGQIMENTFITWDDFVDNFGKEMVSAEDVYNSMVKSGLIDFSLAEFDFHFISDKKENLEKLNSFILVSYPYTTEKIKRYDDNWELTGKTNGIPVTKEILLYWALDMYKRGYEFDSDLEGYGAEVDKKNPKLPDFEKSKEDFYFNKAIDSYNSGDLSGAMINWTIVLKINPKEPNSYYSRAIVKNELYTWKSAIKDYDKAIELAPKFIDAILNRGSVKDENGDYDGAITDYDLVISLSEKDLPNLQMAYFNRGNTKHNMNNHQGACQDWNKAKELGADYADERINIYCK